MSQHEMEDSLNEDLLLPPGGATLSNSPTTDTLDSVALETTPTDDPTLGEGEEDEEEEGARGPADRGGLDTGISFTSPADTDVTLTSPANITIDLNASVAPDNPAAFFDQPTAEGQGQGISSYFAQPDAGEDFFQSITGGDSDRAAGVKSGGAFDDFGDPSFDKANKNPAEVFEKMPERPEAADVLAAGDLQVESLLDDEDDEGEESESEEVVDGAVRPDITTVIHREHKVSTSEPETVGFEGAGGETGSEVTDICDLTEKDEEFESFTAGEGSGVIGRTVERSDSLPQGEGAQGRGGEEVGGLSISGPSVGTTPTQMSPLHTPAHHPRGAPRAPPPSQALSTPPPPPPQTAAPEPPHFDTQPSAQGSPFHLPPDAGLAGTFSSFPDAGPLAGNFSSFPDAGGEDAFSASLSVSDADRRFDAWVPSDATRHVLLTMATSPPGTFTPAPQQLSCPMVLSTEPQGDPVRDLVYRYMGEQEAVRRQVLTSDLVSQDCEGLQKLVDSGCLRAAVDLTGRLLTSGGQGQGESGTGGTQHSPQMLQLWFCRFALMTKLRLYEAAEAEMRMFQNLDTPDLYFEFYPHKYPGRRGSMVCFAMRLLHADLPHLNGRSQETLDRLYYMLAVVTKVSANLDQALCEDGSSGHLTADSRKLSIELWQERERQVLYKIAGTLLSVKDYQAALAMYNTLLDKDLSRRAQLLTGISRIHLQMGNVTKANEIHTEVEKLLTKGDNSAACCNAMNKGLSAMCINNFSEAYNHFKTAVQLEPSNTCAVNNMAVCSLYLGRLKDALNTLEAVVHSDPARTLHEGILFNLCTLYELESSRALHKKQAVLDLVSKHKGDGFPIACLKMA